MLIFEVPPGIGDIAWCYAKVACLTQKRDVGFLICDDAPRRSHDFVDLLPGITNLGYGRSYVEARKVLLPYHTDLEKLPDGRYTICLNPHLEAGHRLEEAFPLQETRYHFDVDVPPLKIVQAKALLSLAEGPAIGFYCSSFHHRPDLGFWSPEEWCKMLSLVERALPGCTFVALGAQYDDRTAEVYKMLVTKGFRVISSLGIADIGMTIELIRRLDYFFAFPSGLAIMADVVGTPCMMWYWSNLIPENEGFPDTYADPVHVERDVHINLPYTTVSESFEAFKTRGMQHVSRGARG